MVKGDIYKKNFVVSREIYNGFIELFKDRNPLHTEKDFAIERGFKAEVMHGNILNGFLSYFIGECLPVKNVVIQTQQIRYALPVYLNDSLLLIVEVSDVFESVKMVELSFFFQNTDNKKVAKGKIQIGILE